MKFLYATLFILILSVSSSASCIEEDGIIKLNQQVIDQDVLDDCPNAVPLSSVLEHLQYYEKEFPRVWAVDLNNTQMFQDDLKNLAAQLLPKLPHLKILVLNTVHLDESIWDTVLFPLLRNKELEYLNVVDTIYDNKSIQPILKRGST